MTIQWYWLCNGGGCPIINVELLCISKRAAASNDNA
jgi:hypothetical protein